MGQDPTDRERIQGTVGDPFASMLVPFGEQTAPPAVRIQQEGEGGGRLLIVSLGGAHDVVSWAIVNGGCRRASAVVWREVDLGELGPEADAGVLLRNSLARAGVPDAVGLLTARDVRRYEESVSQVGEVWARAVVTVGLGNALAVGDPPTPAEAAGTINILCQLSVPLSAAARIEACALVATARTAAMLHAALPGALTGNLATGTGTDCIVVAAPVAGREAAEFAGKHTSCGAAIGGAVRAAVGRGIVRWVAENDRRHR